MSQWTHINASIRFDGIKGMTLDPDLGKTVSYDDPVGAWNACDVPRGSEGSLQNTLTEIGDGAVRFVATVWGDLRDYEDVAEIEAYLDRIVEGQGIRSGVAEIEVEYKSTKVLRYNNDLDVQAWQMVWEETTEGATDTVADTDVAT